MIVAIEGGDAQGKATQARLLAERLGAEVIGFPDYSTPVGKAILGNLKGEWVAAEPHGYPDGTVIQDEKLNALVRQCLMTANRLELRDRILRHLDDGESVVFDRYYASALVYGELDGLDPEWLRRVQAPLPEPDHWVLLDASVEESVRRRPERRDRYEADLPFLRRVREKYLELFFWAAEKQPPNERTWHIVDGVGSIDEVHARVLAAVGLAP